MSTRTLILLFLCLASFTTAQIIPIEFYHDNPKYFPANTFDTFNSDAFRTQAYGSFKYSIGTWLRISRALTGTEAILLHLTALDVDFPWDSAQYTSDIRHLANLIRVKYESGELHVDVGSFTDYANTESSGYTIGLNCWHYIYVGVNHETGKFTVGIFSNGCTAQQFWTADATLDSTYSNEALDNRLTLYLGGSKNHVTTVNAAYESWPGSLYRTLFLNGFYTNSENTARFLMGGERKNMYFFYLDNKVFQQTIQSATDSNSYIALGATNNPVLNGQEGFQFTDAAGSTMSLTLSNELNDYNFISFWVKIDDVTPASAQHNVMSIRTPSGIEFLSIMYDKANLRFVLRRSATTSTTPAPAALDTWHFMFLTYNYDFGDSSTSIVVSWRVNTSPIMSNQRLSDPLPADILKPNAKVYFGKITGASDSVFDGYIKNIIGGSGTYFLFDTTTTCTLSIGFQSPYCLYCSPSSSLYSDPSGSCVSTCPDGTYKDIRTMTCIPCDSTCSTCSGPGPEACTTCAEDTPLFFKSMCFSSCPDGTLKNTAGGCDCDSSCSTCNYDSTSKGTQCVGCKFLNTLFLLPDKSRCVPPIECPTNTLADTVTKTCVPVASCPAGKVRDFANGRCYDTVCPVGSSKVAGAPDSCYTKCPEGTYKTTNPAPATDETDILCAPCTAPCKTCETTATKCLSCTGLNLFHEDINTCATTCDTGFSFSELGYFCKACRKGCTACSSILSLVAGASTADNLCVDTCPLGMTSVARVCQPSAVVDAQIINKTASVPTIMISRKQNLVLIGEYASPATVTSVKWSLDTADTTLISQFFNGVVRTNKYLVIPAANLKADTTYKVTFEVQDSVPSTDLEFVMVKTSAEIVQGSFSVQPQEGTAFQTEFTILISGFNALAGYKFDITSYFERNHTINGQIFKERVETITIGSGVDQGSYAFIFPISQAKKPVTVEACAYTDYERQCMTRVITLLPSGDLPLQKVLVWSADASTLKTLDRMLDFVRSISLFYSRTWDNQISTEYSRGALLIDNFAVTKNLVACNKIAECSNAGACSVSGSTFTCSCELGFGGFSCFYGVREFDTISTRVRDILTNLYSVSLDITTVEKTLLILQELTSTLDMIEYNSIFFFRDIVANVLKVPNLKSQHFRPIFFVLGEVIGFVKRSLTATWFKATDRSLLLVSLTDLVDSAFGMLDGVRMSDSYFLVDTNFLKVMVINNVAGGFLGNAADVTLKVDWETFGFTLPQDLVATLPSSSVKMLGYKINPYSDAQTNGQMTSVMKVEIFNVNGAVPVSGLTNNIELRIPKLAATPVFVPVTGTSAYNCQYKSSTVRSKINFLTTGCSFVSESETHVTCSCNHLTEFVSQLNLTLVAVAPSSADILETNNAYITEILAFETSKRAYYPTVVTPTTPTITPEVKIVRDFEFPNIGLYFAAAIVGLYLLFMLCNMGGAKKNALKKFLDQGQSILVLTYHPVLSMFIKAHTTTSNTQLMRITKFFCMLSSYAGLTSIFYLLLDLELSLNGVAKLIISAILTLIFGPLLCYGTELAYSEIQRASGKQRRSGLYQYSHFIMMILWAAATIGLVGLIRSEYRNSWMGSFILTAVLDIVVFDMIILIFAMMQKNNSKYLKLFRARGYYVDTGKASIITPEDEAALIAKIKKVLHTETLRDMDSAAVPAFGNVNRLVGELEDLNASQATEINAEEILKDKIGNDDQPEQHYESQLPPLDENQQEEGDGNDQEIPDLVHNIARASVRQPVMRSLSYKPKPVDTKRKSTRGNK